MGGGGFGLNRRKNGGKVGCGWNLVAPHQMRGGAYLVRGLRYARGSSHLRHASTSVCEAGFSY